MQSASVLSLQAPKDVSLSQIELELSKIWQSYGDTAAARATTFNLLVYEPENEVGARLVSIDTISSQNPCRVIDLCPISGEDEGITAQVAAYCPIQKTSSSLICGEYITLRGTREAFSRIHPLLSDLVIPDLPTFVWWKDSPAPYTKMFERLTNLSDRMIFDSAFFKDSEADLLKMYELINNHAQVADLNWRRLAPWQELTAQAFDSPDRRPGAWKVDRVTIDYEKGNSTQALMFLGWLASRLDWQPISLVKEGGDYNIQKIRFIGRNNLDVQAELAAIPVGDVGDVEGDLVGLKLTSTDPDAEISNVFCSESMGCMRMEAGAQSIQTYQVSPLSDQSANLLLSQQLQRWGREVLYEESLALTAEILKLS
ncbi:opcA protein [Synechococcus sp. PCC 7502]|uniref:glucose-6-phosphate dehydrogenase assembly protein OpcA n=1 Tax=Synechococcus sp. PCC 7502 TaxID=1173263 RepID=UPI00029FE62C|nr:glucose-6-phosphate dehydrogenase assembly protein OpcA [Synechococcus sp. PCC 7502]AFY73110.1 opcA protein [Synechococcus sp. PCC 7502]